MPNLANAKKALRQADRRAARNKVKREELHSLRRMFRKLVEAGKLDEAKNMIPKLDKKIDKAIKDNIIKKNAGARVKSRLHGKLERANVK
jgi:small subunit ribosomal protein S20